MRRTTLGRLFAALLAFAGTACAQVQTAAPAPPEDLYEQALQSIAEGRNSDASATLTRVIETEPLHAGAWMDLALIQCALGHEEEAERLFHVIESRFAPPPPMLELIGQARASGCNHWQAHSQYSVALGRGSDQNVNQGASNPIYTIVQDGVPVELPLLADFLPKRDDYVALSADYLRDITPNGSVGFVQLQSRRNDALRQYDSSTLFVGVETPWRFGRWTVRGTAMTGLVSLGGALYQRQSQLAARIGPPLPLPGSLQFHILTSLSHLNYRTLSNFNANSADLKGQFSWAGEHYSVNATGGFQIDHAIDDRPGGDRHGTLFALQGKRAFDDAWTGELGYSHQNWRGQSAYSPGLIDVVRDQTTHVLRGALAWQIDKHQSLQLEARQIWNRENVSLFQYNNHQLQLSWQWSGP